MNQEYKNTYIDVNKFNCFTQNNFSCINSFMNYGKRLQKARLLANLTQKQLAEALSVSQANISQLEITGGSGSIFTVQIAEICNVSARWLATGEGEMMVSQYPLSNQQNHVLKAMQLMNEYDQSVVVKIADSLAESEKPNGTEK